MCAKIFSSLQRNQEINNASHNGRPRKISATPGSWRTSCTSQFPFLRKDKRTQCLCHYSSGAHRPIVCGIPRFCCRATASIPDRRFLLPSPKCNHCNRFCTISNAQDSRQDVAGVGRDALRKILGQLNRILKGQENVATF